MSGFCSQPWAADEPQKAAELAIKAGEYAIEKIIKAVAKANKEEEAKVDAQIKRMAEESEKHRLDLEGVSLSSDDHAQVSKIQNGAEQVFHPETN